MSGPLNILLPSPLPPPHINTTNYREFCNATRIKISSIQEEGEEEEEEEEEEDVEEEEG